jgi:hypothetical protein
METLRKPFPDLLASICQLRHTAVHRNHLPASSTLDFIMDAELLAGLLQDVDCVGVLSTMRQRTQDTIEKLERERNLLVLKMAEIRKLFTKKRAELQRQESKLLEAVVRDSKSRTFFASADLEQTLDPPHPVQTRKEHTDDVAPAEQKLTVPNRVAEQVLEPEPEGGGVRLIEEFLMIKPLRLLPRLCTSSR